jgi:hypothetical protein
LAVRPARPSVCATGDTGKTGDETAHRAAD